MRLLCAYAVRACARVFGSRSLLGDVCFNLQLCARIDRGNGCGYGFQTSISHTWTRFKIPQFHAVILLSLASSSPPVAVVVVCVLLCVLVKEKQFYTHTRTRARVGFYFR